MTETLGVAQSTLSIRLKSIIAKSAIITEDIDQGKKIYSINPQMNLNTEYWKGLDLIDLKIEDSQTYRSQLMPLLQSYCSVIGVPIGIIINNSNRIPSSLLLNMDESMKEICFSCCGRWTGENISSSRVSQKDCNNHEKQLQEPLLHYNKQGNNDPSGSNNDSSKRPDTTIRQSGDAVGNMEADLLRAENQRKAAEAHDKEQAAMYTPKKLAPTDLVEVRFLKEYRTQVPRPGFPDAYDDRLYRVGEIATLQRWKAEDLLRKGIVELVA